jgi:hypothetical protein
VDQQAQQTHQYQRSEKVENELPVGWPKLTCAHDALNGHEGVGDPCELVFGSLYEAEHLGGPDDFDEREGGEHHVVVEGHPDYGGEDCDGALVEAGGSDPPGGSSIVKERLT